VALDIDVVSVLRAIEAEPALFSGVRADIAKETGKFITKLRSLLVKQIKVDAGDADALRAVRRRLGADSFDLVVDGMKATDLKTIVKKLDPHNGAQKTASAEWRRRRLYALLDGSAEPAPPVRKKARASGAKAAAPSTRRKAPPGKAKRARKPADQNEFLFDPSAGAVRDEQDT
jgi:hypothetical protein